MALFMRVGWPRTLYTWNTIQYWRSQARRDSELVVILCLFIYLSIYLVVTLRKRHYLLRRPRGRRTSNSSPTRILHPMIWAMSSRAFGGTQIYLGEITRCQQISQLPCTVNCPSIAYFPLMCFCQFIRYNYRQWRPPLSHLRDSLSLLLHNFHLLCWSSLPSLFWVAPAIPCSYPHFSCLCIHVYLFLFIGVIHCSSKILR